MFYADSSYLSSVYLRDINSQAANQFLADTQTSLAFTSLNRIEIRNLFRSLVAGRATTSATIARAFSTIEQDLFDGMLTEKKVDAHKAFQMAEQLSARHAERHGVRCVDLLHVANAHVLGLEVFLTFDRQQAAFALQTGLKVPLTVRNQ